MKVKGGEGGKEGGREKRKRQDKKKRCSRGNNRGKKTLYNWKRHAKSLVPSTSVTSPKSHFEPELLVNKYQHLPNSTTRIRRTHGKWTIIISLFK